MPRSAKDRSSSARALLETANKGRPLEPQVARELRRLMGVDVSLEGLSRVFQPGFTAVRAFIIEAHVAADHAVEFGLIGVARDGRPVWTGSRALCLGRDGSLELHRGFDEIDAEFQSRNITVDLMQRELDLLALLDSGPAARLTIDAENVGRYVCALHGFVFADETEEGPPVRSQRAHDPVSDRERLAAAAKRYAERSAERRNLGRIALEATLEQIERARTPWDFLRLELGEPSAEHLASDDGKMGVGAFGREFLLARETPGWRAALYLHPRDPEPDRWGSEYRRRKTVRAEMRLANEVQEAIDQLGHASRTIRLRALETLGRNAPAGYAADAVKSLLEDRDRKVAATAKQTLRALTSAELMERLYIFAQDPKADPRLRGVAYRALAEHAPARLAAQVTMLRVHPDARIQRAAIPLESEDAPALAALLAANPWVEPGRPGLRELRLELIERLVLHADPMTLPALLAAFRAEPRPAQDEHLALTRALVAIPDPRAQVVLSESARRMNRPQIP